MMGESRELLRYAGPSPVGCVADVFHLLISLSLSLWSAKMDFLLPVFSLIPSLPFLQYISLLPWCCARVATLFKIRRTWGLNKKTNMQLSCCCCRILFLFLAWHRNLFLGIKYGVEATLHYVHSTWERSARHKIAVKHGKKERGKESVRHVLTLPSLFLFHLLYCKARVWEGRQEADNRSNTCHPHRCLEAEKQCWLVRLLMRRWCIHLLIFLYPVVWLNEVFTSLVNHFSRLRLPNDKKGGETSSFSLFFPHAFLSFFPPFSAFTAPFLFVFYDANRQPSPYVHAHNNTQTHTFVLNTSTLFFYFFGTVAD